MPAAASQGLLNAHERAGRAQAHGLRRVVFNLQNESDDRSGEGVADMSDWLHPEWIVRGEEPPASAGGSSDNTPVAPLPSPALLGAAGLLTLAGARRRR